MFNGAEVKPQQLLGEKTAWFSDDGYMQRHFLALQKPQSTCILSIREQSHFDLLTCSCAAKLLNCNLTSYSLLTVSECGRFLAWLEHVRFKATLKITPLWIFFFFFTFSTVKTTLNQTDSNVCSNNQRGGKEITSFTKI